MAMTKDYEQERDRMSARAIEVWRVTGPERAVQIYLGAIDALTVAVFAVNGSGAAIGLAIDNTKSNQDGGIAA